MKSIFVSLLLWCMLLMTFVQNVKVNSGPNSNDGFPRKQSGDRPETDRRIVKRSFKFTAEELLNTKFSNKISNDVDVDPCKAGNLIGEFYMT